MLQAGLCDACDVMTEAKVHVNDGLKALGPGEHGNILLLASSKVDGLCHVCFESLHLGL